MNGLEKNQQKQLQAVKQSNHSNSSWHNREGPDAHGSGRVSGRVSKPALLHVWSWAVALRRQARISSYTLLIHFTTLKLHNVSPITYLEDFQSLCL